MKGFKRCKCREGGRELGASCPKLRRRDGSWNPAHGTWYGKTELPPGADGSRVALRAGGFTTQDEMSAWFDEAMLLLSIPAKGADGHESRMQILGLIRESRRRQEDLPSFEDIRRRYATGAAFRPGSAGEYLKGWLGRHKTAGDWSAATLHSYERAVDRLFLPAFGDVPLDKLSAKHVLDVLAAVDDEADRIRAARESPDPEIRKSVAGLRPPGPATKQRHLAVIRSALGEAASVGLHGQRVLTVNVAAGIRLGRSGGGKAARRSRRSKALLWTAERERKWRAGFERRADGLTRPGRFLAWQNTAARPSNVMIWKPAHLAAFLDAPEVQADRLYPMFETIAYCGLRRGEACGLRWEDIDWGTGTFMIGETVVRAGRVPALVQEEAKSEESEDWVSMAQELMASLRAWRRRQSEERLAWGEAWTDSGRVFTLQDGTGYKPGTVSQRFERLSYRLGLPPIRLHDLRHGAATLALAAGKDIKVVSAMLRHSSHKITGDLYASVLPELAAEASEAVASMIPRKRATGN